MRSGVLVVIMIDLSNRQIEQTIRSVLRRGGRDPNLYREYSNLSIEHRPQPRLPKWNSTWHVLHRRISNSLLRLQYLLDRFKQRSGVGISPSIGAGGTSHESHRPASRTSASLHIPLRITDHPRRGQIDFMFTRRREQHTRLRLAATTRWLLLVRAIVDSIDPSTLF